MNLLQYSNNNQDSINKIFKIAIVNHNNDNDDDGDINNIINNNNNT